MRRKVYIAYTGGTIGMAKGADGYEPRPGLLRQLLGEMKELNENFNPEAPILTVKEYQPLLDSSNMTPANWLEIARDIERNYDEHDGFVVLHGTDTLAYTASALSFLIEAVGKPVVVTGSQIPLVEPRTDARSNLVTAIDVAARHEYLTEVCVVFNSKIMRGNRVTKVSAEDFDAFDSPRAAPLGTAGIQIKIDRRRLRPPAMNTIRLYEPSRQGSVGVLRLFPGISSEFMEAALSAKNLRGLVLEAFGSGNGPDKDQAFLAAIRRAADRGVVVLVVSQPLRGGVDFTYAAGSALRKAGAISGYDMTTEAALTKLFYVLGIHDDPKDVRRVIGQNLRGELTRRREFPASVKGLPKRAW